MEHPSHNAPSASPAMKRVTRMALTGLAVCAALSGLLVAALSAGSIEAPPHAGLSTSPAASGTGHAASRADVRGRAGFAHVVKMVRPAVVNITVSRAMRTGPAETPWHGRRGEFGRDPGGGPFFGTPPSPAPRRNPRGMGMGSGVIVSPDGYVATNHHVIAGAKTVTVTLLDKRTFAGTIVGSDPQTDLAVIDIQGTNLPFIPWGDSSSLEVGDYVLAIGSPFGLHSTVTQGIVSAKGRGGMGITQYEDFIQTDAAINPGNSGGALVNMRGELVGINTAILSRTGGSQGVGFAVPADIGRHVSTSLVTTGTVSRGFLGVGIQAVTPELAQSFHMDRPEGAIVTNVRDASPAGRAGLQRGDVVIQYREQPIAAPRDLQRAVTTTPVGTDVTIRVVRDGKERTVRATIMEHPDTQHLAAAQPPGHESHLAGLAVENLTPPLARRLGVDDRMTGVVVTGFRDGSRAEEAGLMRGDIIREVNHQPVTSLNAFRRTVRDLPNDQPILLFIHRRGTPLFLTVTV